MARDDELEALLQAIRLGRSLAPREGRLRESLLRSLMNEHFDVIIIGTGAGGGHSCIGSRRAVWSG